MSLSFICSLYTLKTNTVLTVKHLRHKEKPVQNLKKHTAIAVVSKKICMNKPELSNKSVLKMLCAQE